MTRFNKREISQKQLRHTNKICFTFLVNMNIATHSDSFLELMLNVLRFASQLMLPLRPRPRLMPLFFMEDMDMVDLDMVDLAMVDLDTLLLDIVVLAILVLAIMARDLLMLNPKPRLMPVSFMEDMDMEDLDMLD